MPDYPVKGGVYVYITEQYYMYRLAYQLTKYDTYEVLHLNPKTNEVLLGKFDRKKTNVIRFIHKGFDWKNHLKIDIATLFQRVKSMDRLLLGKHVDIYNVYVTSHEPVDEWEFYKKPIHVDNKAGLRMHVFYMVEETRQTEKERLFSHIGAESYEDMVLPAEEDQELAVTEYKLALRNHLYRRNEEIKGIFTYGKPLFTYIFIGVNLALFLLLEMAGGSTDIPTLIAFGAKFNPLILLGEWWRIVTSMFLHIGLVHLFMNMLALYYLGMVVEQIYGSIRFLVIYFLAGIGGGLTSFAFNDSVAAGASGALFGLFGALLFFGVNYKRLFFQTMGRNLILILAINLLLGFMIPQIDMGAHLGGLVTGFVAAAITSLPKKRHVLYQILFTLLYIGLSASLIVYGIMRNVALLSS